MTLSDRTKRLLSGGESGDVEYKTKVTQEFNDTLVAYANASGGTCLFGIEDAEDDDGRHIGRVVGIDVSDRTRGQIQSRADQTHDKIEIEISAETDDDGRSVYVVDVREGTRKPYCTGGGRYLVRRDGQNTIITPAMMEDFVAPRVHRGPSAKKQLWARELETLKREFQVALSDARHHRHPFHEQRIPGLAKLFRVSRADDLVAGLSVDDAQLREACVSFIKAADDLSSALAIAHSRLVGTHNPANITQEVVVASLMHAGGAAFYPRLELAYRTICARIDALLS